MMNLKISLIVLSILAAQPSFARSLEGTEGGNGGDACEAGIYEVKDDIASWIKVGGAAGLKFSAPTNQSVYSAKMIEALSAAKVSCVEESLKIGFAEKTCINVIEQGEPRIFCNAKRLASTPIADQYVLIHHEYAGLAGLEVNEGEVSQYEISRQLTAFLEQSVVTRLAIKPRLNGSDLMECRDNYVRAFSAQLKDGRVLLRLEAIGYADRLEFLESLGVPKEKAYTVLEFNVPAQNCSWAGGGRLSCIGQNPTLFLKNKQGDTESLKAFKFSLFAGEVGSGPNSYRRVELSIEKDGVTATDFRAYRYCHGVLSR